MGCRQLVPERYYLQHTMPGMAGWLHKGGRLMCFCNESVYGPTRTWMWMSASNSQLLSNSSPSSGLYGILVTRLSWLRACRRDRRHHTAGGRTVAEAEEH